MDCEMCGKGDAAFKAMVEGTTLAVCEGCSKYGKVVGRIILEQPVHNVKELKEQEEEFVVANIGSLLKQKRESLGMKQEEFAKKIAVKESMLHNMERGALKPSLEEARRMGKMLGLSLIEKIEPVEQANIQTKKDQLTLGDMIKVRKK